MQYVISDVVGNGQFPGRGEALTDANGPYRPVAERYATDFVHAIDEVEGKCISVVAGEDLAAMSADSRCLVIPPTELDEVFQATAAANNWLTNRGYPPLAQPGMTKRELLIAVATYINPSFSRMSVGGYGLEPAPDG